MELYVAIKFIIPCVSSQSSDGRKSTAHRGQLTYDDALSTVGELIAFSQ